jgi:hypothetical protein
MYQNVVSQSLEGAALGSPRFETTLFVDRVIQVQWAVFE